ncbi:MAG: hypothetical protein ACLQGP_17785 [Isosphaeraceae bacterium]
MLTRSRLVLGLCGLAIAAPAMRVSASPDDVPSSVTAPVAQPAAVAQPPIVMEQEPGAQPWSTYQPTSGSPSPSPSAPVFQPPSGFQSSTHYQPRSAYQPPSDVQPQTAAGFGTQGAAPAQPPSDVQPQTVAAYGTQKAAPAPHHHKGLFGWRHCVECQRARAKKQDGVEIPPPPGPPEMAGMAVRGETMVTGPVIMMDSDGHMVKESQEAGFAVVGDPSAPGVAVVGESGPSSEPVPVGVARGAQMPSADPLMAAMARRPGAGSYDASVVPTSIPAAPQAMSGPGHNRPHIISHIFGLPQLGRHRREQEAKERQQHAAIAYGDANKKVNELPASMVYSNGSR